MAILESSTQTGVSWVKESFAIFKQSPRKWLMLALVYVGLFMMMPSLPGFQAFAILTILIWPIFIAIAMRMYRNAEIKTPEVLSDIVKLVQPKMTTLMLLGVVCLIYGILVNFLLNSDLQGLAAITQGKTEINESQMMALLQKMLPFLLKLTLFLVPLMMATWFSPMLIAFNSYSLGKAIKSSIAGTLQHMLALTVSWLLLTTGIILSMLFAGIVVGILGALVPSMAQLFMSILVFGCLLLASALMLAFQYVSYRDVFRAVIKV
ncbi:MAG: BPSS1780 family membrane protein [Methylophilaceae bacterium]